MRTPILEPNAAQDTDSYRQSADGPYLTAKAMAWFWDSYLPGLSRRAEITASPLRATLDQLSALPETFRITDENDVLRMRARHATILAERMRRMVRSHEMTSVIRMQRPRRRRPGAAPSPSPRGSHRGGRSLHQ